MKNLLVLFICITNLTFYGQATDSVKKATGSLPMVSVDASYGFANLQQLNFWSKSPANYSIKWFGPCMAKINLRLNKEATLSIMYGYTTINTTIIQNAQSNISVQKRNSVGLRYTLYIVQKPKFNFYAGIGGGAVFQHTDDSKMHIGYENTLHFSPYYFDLIAGVSYKILNPISLFADVGLSSYSLLQAGIRVAVKQ
jgi:hypothetical protein